MKCKHSFLMLCASILLATTNASAQVTVGAGTMPKATLDVVTSSLDANTPEGVIAPRLTGEQIKAKDNAYTSAQTGAIVYATAAVATASTKTANITAPGYYYFDGSIWQTMKGGSELSANNGVNRDGSNIQLGGNLTEDTAINQNGNSFDVIPGTGEEFHVDGNFRADNVYVDNMGGATSTNLQNVVWNQDNKRLEYSSGGDVTVMTFMQTEVTQENKWALGGSWSTQNNRWSGGTVDAEKIIILPWNNRNNTSTVGGVKGDVVVNNGLTSISTATNPTSTNTAYGVFTLQKDANVELSGYCGYSADITGATAEAIIVNASIQVRAAGVSTGGDKGDGWVSYSSVRGVYIDNQQWYRHTLAIPPAMYAGKAGDQIRMVIVLKPANVDSREHTAPALVAPYGTLFSKSIKIVQM